MPEFKSWESYWKFEEITKNKARYIHTPEVKEFLNNVLHTSKARTEILAQGAILWRSQLGHSMGIYQDGECHPIPYSSSRMIPEVSRAKEGRANPKGIPYLYLSTNRDTALAEVRPWIGSLISVAQFKTVRELRLINCVANPLISRLYFEEPSAEEREKFVWSEIDRSFAKPIDKNSDDVADYVPTQIIAEFFKINKFDGVAYRSSLGEGYNMALFGLDMAELVNCSLFEAKGIKHEFCEL
jgi:hypothetical protein